MQRQGEQEPPPPPKQSSWHESCTCNKRCNRTYIRTWLPLSQRVFWKLIFSRLISISVQSNFHLLDQGVRESCQLVDVKSWLCSWAHLWGLTGFWFQKPTWLRGGMRRMSFISSLSQKGRSYLPQSRIFDVQGGRGLPPSVRRLQLPLRSHYLLPPSRKEASHLVVHSISLQICTAPLQYFSSHLPPCGGF